MIHHVIMISSNLPLCFSLNVTLSEVLSIAMTFFGSTTWFMGNFTADAPSSGEIESAWCRFRKIDSV